MNNSPINPTQIPEMPMLDFVSSVTFAIIAVSGIVFFYRIIKAEQESKKAVIDARLNIDLKRQKALAYKLFKRKRIAIDEIKVISDKFNDDIISNVIDDINTGVINPMIQDNTSRIKKLKKQLEISLENEDYMMCATVRDQLDSLYSQGAANNTNRND